MMTQIFTCTLKVLRPTLLAAAMSLSAPVFGLIDQSLNGTSSSVAVVNLPKLATPANTTIIYKNAFLGT
jgi:hypothetical protein